MSQAASATVAPLEILVSRVYFTGSRRGNTMLYCFQVLVGDTLYVSDGLYGTDRRFARAGRDGFVKRAKEAGLKAKQLSHEEFGPLSQKATKVVRDDQNNYGMMRLSRTGKFER
jgi:hypothetical protein